MDSRDRDDDVNTELAGQLVDRMFTASQDGNEPLAARYGELAAAAMSGGPNEMIKVFVEGPEYNDPRAVEARRYVGSAENQHNRAITELRDLFRRNVRGEEQTRKLRREFVRVCARMERHLQQYTYKYPNGSTDSGARIIVEGELSRDPAVKAQANMIYHLWNQGRFGVEIGTRAAMGLGMNEGPRLAV